MLRGDFYNLVRSAVAACGYAPYFFFEGDMSITGILPPPGEEDLPVMSDTDLYIKEPLSGWEEVPRLLGVPEVEGIAVLALQAPDFTSLRAYVMFVVKGATDTINLRRLEMNGAGDNADAWDASGNLRRTPESLTRFFQERKAKGYDHFHLSEGSLRALLTASRKCVVD